MLERKIIKIQDVINLLGWEVQGIKLKGTKIELSVKHRGRQCYKDVYVDNTRNKNVTKEVYTKLAQIYN